MNKLFTLIIALWLSSTLWAQNPQKMSYQAVIRDASNKLITNHSIGMRISITKVTTQIIPTSQPITKSTSDIITEIPVYVETQQPTSNENGLVTIEIGGGTILSGTFASIDWANGKYFIKIESDPTGGTTYSIVGESQLLSVPYALYAEKSGSGFNNNRTDTLFLYTPLGRKFKIKLEENGTLTTSEVIIREGSVSDVDGNSYYYKTIGTQVWLTENLKTTKFANGSPIPNVTDSTVWHTYLNPAYCWVKNDIKTKDRYGALYNMYAANSDKICPAGWRVPTEVDWTTLINYLGGETVAGGKLKEIGTVHWAAPNTGADNSSGFTAFPGVERFYSGITNTSLFGAPDNTVGSWWCLSGNDGIFTIEYVVFYNLNDLRKNLVNISNGVSVRCIKK